MINKGKDLLSALLRSPFSNKDYELVSFDVFDTVLRRECGSYKGIFVAVGKKIGLEGFPELRKATETQLLRSHNLEITIDDIYDELSRNSNDYDWDSVKQIELETEARNLKPAGRASRFLERTRKTGAKVIFISDMYLSSNWIKGQLKKHGLWKDGDEIFVSCDIGANKRSGEIYRKVRERLPSKNWLHVGDNLIADIVNAHREGIDVRWLPNSYLESFSFHAGRVVSRFGRKS